MCGKENTDLENLVFSKLYRPLYLEIDLRNVVFNLRQFKALVGKEVDILVAIKGNAYGLGALEIAQKLDREDIYGFSTGSIYEALQMRKMGISRPIQIFPGITENAARELYEHDLMPTFAVAGEARRFKEALGDDLPLKVWLKMDTGLGRFGFTHDELLEEIKYIKQKTSFVIDGLCSHIGPVDSVTNTRKEYYNQLQISRFSKAKASIESAGYSIPHYQLASAFATQRYPQAWFNTVCVGTSLYYAQHPETPAQNLPLKMPIKALKSKLMSIKHFRAGDTCMDQVFTRKRTIGTIAIGMADGLMPANIGRDVLIRGKRYKIFSVCLEHCLIDLEGAQDVQLYDTVTLLGQDGNESIGLEEICAHNHLEDVKLPVVELSHPSLPRAYVDNDSFVKLVVNGSSVNI